MSIENEKEPDKKDNRCLVPRHKGPDPYFVSKGQSGPKTPQGLPQQGPVGRSPHRAVDDLSQRTHNRPSPQGQLNRVYPDAIEMAANSGVPQGFGVVFVILLLFASAIPAVGCILLVYQLGILTPLVFLPILFFLAFLGCLLAASYATRGWLWMPYNRPLLFNRRTREVTVLHTSQPPGLKFWERPETWITTCAWDQIKVRTYKGLSSPTGGKSCQLYLVWDEPDDPRVLKDYALLGQPDAGIDDHLFAVWEYVRRYMEEDGPAIPPGIEIGDGYAKFPNPFPQDVIDEAGGQAYSREKVNAMAEQGEFKTE